MSEGSSSVSILDWEVELKIIERPYFNCSTGLQETKAVFIDIADVRYSVVWDHACGSEETLRNANEMLHVKMQVSPLNQEKLWIHTDSTATALTPRHSLCHFHWRYAHHISINILKTLLNRHRSDLFPSLSIFKTEYIRIYTFFYKYI